MILATKSGWLILCELIKETDKTFTVKPVDSKREKKVSKASKTQKLFNDADAAYDWVKEINSD